MSHENPLVHSGLWSHHCLFCVWRPALRPDARSGFDWKEGCLPWAFSNPEHSRAQLYGTGPKNSVRELRQSLPHLRTYWRLCFTADTCHYISSKASLFHTLIPRPTPATPPTRTSCVFPKAVCGLCGWGMERKSFLRCFSQGSVACSWKVKCHLESSVSKHGALRK